MQTTARPHLRRVRAFVLLAASAALLTACATPEPKAMVYNKPRSKEYFSESEYGVKASPRPMAASAVGRDQLGKPYKVRGRWYYPKEDRRYARVGNASWYGDAFHGRLTANGEVYDMDSLTAAHPTMPLPSYARVTNLANGSSIIVRVNDRGPYADDRIIDLSQRAAHLLDYDRVGTARVKVEYVGRAPLEGNDGSYLMASYRPGNRAPDPSDGLPTGVMVAMNGPTPTMTVGASAVPFPGALTNADSAPPQPVLVADASFTGVVLPDFGPIVPERPDGALIAQLPFAVASLNYADERVSRAASAFAALDGSGLSPTAVVDAWKRGDPASPLAGYIAAGTFGGMAEARQIAKNLTSLGKTDIEQSELDGRDWYTVNLYPDGRRPLDDMLQAAWSRGAPDALAIRD